MSVATDNQTVESLPNKTKTRAVEAVNRLIMAFLAGLRFLGLGTIADTLEAIAKNDPSENAALFGSANRGQMGAKRIGSLAIGIGVVGIVLNQMNSIEVVNGSTGVIDVGNIFSVAGDGLQLLVVGVIIAAAAVLLNLWSGF